MPKILVDVNAKGLVKRLRFFGIDTEPAPGLAPDEEVKAKALLEQRLLITRDRALAESMSADQVLLLGSDDIKVQMAEVFERIGMFEKSQWFTRCAECNSLLQALDEDEITAETRIPSFIKNSTDPDLHCAWTCETCSRVYWKGSHYERTCSIMQAFLLQLKSKTVLASD